MSALSVQSQVARSSRRQFLETVTSGSLVLAFKLSGAGPALAVELPLDEDVLLFEPDLFVSIEPHGQVTILAHRSEMGTGIRTALPMVVADEMGANWDRVTIKQAVGDARLGSQNTDGSRSIRRFYDRMRVAGATARMMLEAAAAKKWDVPQANCRAEHHKVKLVGASSARVIDFGGLVEIARELPVPVEKDLVFRPVSDRRYVGKDIAITDADDIVSGKAIYGIDARRPDQLFAVIARPPVLGGRVVEFDSSAALMVSGVEQVVEVPRFQGPHAFQPLGGVAVLAKSTWAAMQGRDALGVKWDDGPNRNYDTDAFALELQKSAESKGKVIRSEGDTYKALNSSPTEHLHEATYYVPHLTHAPMEPPCAVAEVTTNDSGEVVACEVWAATQNPQACQDVLSDALGVDTAQVTVNVTLLGTGFGRKSKPDYVAEAAILSKATGKPVHVTWTREDESENGYYHTVAAAHLRAAVDERGMPTAWLQRSAFPSILTNWQPDALHGAEFETSQGFTTVPYDVPNLQVENGPAKAHLRIGWMRSVAHIYHAFAICSFPDELAHRAGRDPYEYLMELLGPDRHIPLDQYGVSNHGESFDRYPVDVGRLRNVTKRVAEIADWGKRLPKGCGQGIACHRSFLSYCAHVVEVEVTKRGTVRIPRVHVVIDAGTVINPDRVRAQMEGGAVFATGIARYSEITAKNGRIMQSNFDDYEVARIDDSPNEIIVEIVESDAPPAGVGEVGVPTFAPALCNAIFAATGKRIRRLPLSRHDLSWA